MFFLGTGKCPVMERGDHTGARGERGGDILLLAFQGAPVAGLKQAADRHARRAGVTGIDRESLLAIGERFRETFAVGQHGRAIADGFQIVRLERDRLVIAFERLVDAFEHLQHDAAIVERFGVIRLEADCFVTACERFL